MGTHPIFESDFDCLTDKKKMFDKKENVENSESDLSIEISDAISEKETIKFTINVKTTIGSYLSQRGSNEFKVVRSYTDFSWLHSSLSENDLYSGLLIPPKPYKPDFEPSSSRFHQLKEDESTGSLSSEERKILKSELEAEYLSLFKKTVSIHEAFLSRIVDHDILRNDHDLRIFLTFPDDIGVRGKNRKE